MKFFQPLSQIIKKLLKVLNFVSLFFNFESMKKLFFFIVCCSILFFSCRKSNTYLPEEYGDIVIGNYNGEFHRYTYGDMNLTNPIDTTYPFLAKLQLIRKTEVLMLDSTYNVRIEAEFFSDRTKGTEVHYYSYYPGQSEAHIIYFAEKDSLYVRYQQGLSTSGVIHEFRGKR